MKVWQLVEELRKLDQNFDVFVASPHPPHYFCDDDYEGSVTSVETRQAGTGARYVRPEAR